MIEAMADVDKKIPPILIVRRNHARHAHHGGAWKVAYADFVTAMMAFFLVMWLVTQSNPIKQAVQSYFLDPVQHGKNFKSSPIKGGAGPMQGGAIGEGPGDKVTPKDELRKAEEEMQALGARLKEALDAMPGLDILRQNIEIEVTQEGLRIQLIEGADDLTFFRPGGTLLTVKAELILKTIASELKKLPNQLVIEGHTDASDNTGREDYTNWELSADRANAARRAMVEGGIPATQIYNVRGYAANKLRFKEDPLDPRNRRITILVLNRIKGQPAPEDSYESSIIMTKGG
jgi:chemotaxis protein MotB